MPRSTLAAFHEAYADLLLHLSNYTDDTDTYAFGDYVAYCWYGPVGKHVDIHIAKPVSDTQFITLLTPSTYIQPNQRLTLRTADNGFILHDEMLKSTKIFERFRDAAEAAEAIMQVSYVFYRTLPVYSDSVYDFCSLVRDDKVAIREKAFENICSSLASAERQHFEEAWVSTQQVPEDA